jgi:DNA-binding NarL/FixJ family response regulator
MIVDDHAVVRRGLKQIIESSPELTVTGEAASGQELLRLIRKNDYDIVILDVSMPGMGGIDALKELKAEKPQLPVLIFTIYPEEQYAIRVLKAGASGYVNKESEPEELINAIKVVASGRKHISPNIAELIASNIGQQSETALHETLSDREFQVMCLIASGKTVTEIAEKLSLSINTISTYRVRILEKMSLKNNAELTHYAIKNQLVE